ncbi:hypothetical protein ABID22_003039 [Pontibacter aydingkolensis]|uniref:DoxX-like family protein n=1 Tax=Pontibacter aydingkolensis TaxID=1911536 RepID=A0ABS7CY20_9BACT|nr:hypothetical protein [Pontibacter aydingkolensis]MBW7468700.1 hypothetical protein [Pontibacter aydingkolensis]
MLTVNRSWVTAIVAVTYLLLALSTITKLLFIPYIEAKFEVLEIAGYGRLFGLVELVAFVLYLHPRTIGLGFVLLCSYFGGAIATDLHAPQYLYQPVTVLTLVFISTYLRRPSIYSDKLDAIHKTCCTVIALRKEAK